MLSARERRILAGVDRELGADPLLAGLAAALEQPGRSGRSRLGLVGLVCWLAVLPAAAVGSHTSWLFLTGASLAWLAPQVTGCRLSAAGSREGRR